MLRNALSFLAGVVAVEGASALPSLPVVLLAALVSTALALALRRVWPLAATLGALLAVIQAQAVLAGRLSPSLDGTERSVSGRITGVPQRDADRVQFDLLTDPDAAVPTLPARFRVSWYSASALPTPGEHWRLQLKLRAPRGLLNPGGYDYELRLARDGIGATAYVRPEPVARRLAPAGAREPLARARLALAAAIAAACHDCKHVGVLQALAVGLQNAVPDSDWRRFAATGITHLVAISGLHVTLFAFLTALFVRRVLHWIPRVRGRLDLEALAGVVAATGYALLAGLSVPTLRTVLMLALWAAVLRLRRSLAPFDLLALTLLLVLATDPLAVTTPGFVLSFGAVASILAVCSGRLRQPGWLGTFLLTQGAVSVGLAPLLLAAVGGFSWVSPVANALAIPAFTLLVVPAVLLGTLLAVTAPKLAGLVLGGADRLLDLLFGSLDLLLQLPGAGWSPASLSAPLLLVATLAVLVILIAMPGTVRGLGLASLAALLTVVPARPVAGEWRLTLLDVGQGLAAVVETAGHVLVFDTGPGYRSGQSAGSRVLVPFLKQRGWRVVDALVLSHDDLDHTGGAADLAGSVPSRRVLAGRHLAGTPCRAGQSWVWDAVRFEVVHPAGDVYDNDNDGSCVLSVTGAGARALLVADLGGDVESELVATARVPVSDVVLVSHHGSQGSSRADWIAAVNARYALVSAARGNRWRFPRPEAVARWRAQGSQVLATADAGAVTIDSATARAVTPVSERQRQQRWWRAP